MAEITCVTVEVLATCLEVGDLGIPYGGVPEFLRMTTCSPRGTLSFQEFEWAERSVQNRLIDFLHTRTLQGFTLEDGWNIELCDKDGDTLYYTSVEDPPSRDAITRLWERVFDIEQAQREKERKARERAAELRNLLTR